MQANDGELLDQYLKDRNEAAFHVLVQRHLPLVSSVAFRVLRDAELVREVSQQTFIRLAQQAGRMRNDISLLAWLHRTARSYAVDAVRREESRKQREKKAASMFQSSQSGSSSDGWETLEPMVDELLDKLPPGDRQVILLRYYENRSIASLAEALGVTKEAANKRALRALEKLRGYFLKRGIATSSAVLAATLPLHGIDIQRPESAASIASTAFQHTLSASPGLFPLITTMTTATKIALGTAAVLILGLAAHKGFHSTSRTPESTFAPELRSASAGTDESHSSSRNPRSPQSTPAAQDSFSRLVAILKIENSFLRQRQLSDFVASLNPDQFSDVAGKLAELSGPPEGDEMRLLVSAWATQDSEAALRFIMETSQSMALAEVVLKEQLKQDPDAAYQWARAHESEFKGASILQSVALSGVSDDPAKSLSNMLASPAPLRSSVLECILSQQPGKLAEIVGRLSGESERKEAMKAAMAGPIAPPITVTQDGGGGFSLTQSSSTPQSWPGIDPKDQATIDKWQAGQSEPARPRK